MRKNRVYELGVALEGNTLDISQTECGCPAGKGPRGSCKHIAALCYTLADFCRLGVVPEFLTCTDRLQQWNRPHAQRIDLIPVHQLGAHRCELVPPKKKSSGAQMIFDPRPLPQRSADPAALEQLRCELLTLGKSYAILSVLIPCTAKVAHNHCYYNPEHGKVYVQTPDIEPCDASQQLNPLISMLLQ